MNNRLLWVGFFLGAWGMGACSSAGSTDKDYGGGGSLGGEDGGAGSGGSGIDVPDSGFLEVSTEDTALETGGTKEPIPVDCTGCQGIGEGLENLLCAIELCDPKMVMSSEYHSPTATKPQKIASSRSAVARFGAPNNGLAPLVNDSYALMATGPAKGTDHNVTLGDFGLTTPDGASVPDPFAPPQDTINLTYDVMEWKLRLKAPAEAHGFRINYVFFSEEYDEYIGREFNDKFYIFLEAASTNGGARTVINFTECRDPNSYHDFTCSAAQAANDLCHEGDRFCYVAINTALSDCCWYQGCPNKTKPNTDISGTGFSCGTEQVDGLGDGSMGHTYGSSTGWLKTEWPIEPNEEFTLIFHIHDTADSLFDSEVILDGFTFLTQVDKGTAPVVK